MEPKKPQRMKDSRRAIIRAALWALTTKAYGPWPDEAVESLLADGDALREEVEALKAELAAVRTHPPAVDATSPALRACVPSKAGRLSEQDRRRWREQVHHAIPRSLEDAFGALCYDHDEALAAEARACVPVPAEPVLTTEELDRLSVLVFKARGLRDGTWQACDEATTRGWRQGVLAVYREGYAAAMAQVRLGQPSAQPSAEQTKPWPPAVSSAWTNRVSGDRWDVVRVSADGVTLSTEDGRHHSMDRSYFLSVFCPWKEAEPGTTPTNTPQQHATTEERMLARIREMETNWCHPIEERTSRLEERVGVLEAEGARVRDQAARTEQALREVVEWMTWWSDRNAPLPPGVTVRGSWVARARRALGMPETP